MTGLIIFILAVACYEALVHLTPARIGARIGFWAAAVACGWWLLDAIDAAMAHRWPSLAWTLLWAGVCAFGAWCWAGELRRARSRAAGRRAGR